MKLMTLNTHSLQEERAEEKWEWFLEGVLSEKPDLIALQEVNQTQTASPAEEWLKAGQYPLSGLLRQDNFAARTAARLRQAGVDCHWAWLPIKQGYGKYDEGVALLSFGRKIVDAKVIFASRTREYTDWRRRAVLGIRTEGLPDWFYSVHLGWWDDAEEPFLEQWERLKAGISGEKGRVWLMGDFNAPDLFSNQSYTHICRDGWVDTHRVAAEKGKDFTVSGIIDGWRGKLPDERIGGMRLDYIFCNQAIPVRFSKILFDGENRPVVSDHFAVIIETEEGDV